MKLDIIYNKSCVKMGEVDNGSVDLTVTSPPYDNLRTYGGYEFDFELIAQELYRVTKNGGVVVWVVGDATIKGSETGTSFEQALYFKQIGFNFHDTMIFKKNGTGACGSNYAYWQAFEYMFVFSKGKPKTIHFLTTGKLTTIGGSRIKFDGSKKKENRRLTGRESRKDNVWAYSVGNANNDDKTGHPAVFPEQLAQDHILSWSNENDIILDPMAGSGTTPKMAKRLGRYYIGYEINLNYIKLIDKRLAKEDILFNSERSSICSKS